MVANARMTRFDDINSLLAEVTHELVMTGVDDGDGVLALPQQYPGGSPVVVRIRRDGTNFIVSDHGAGYVEAEHLGGHINYNRVASRIALELGVKYDGHMIFVLEVDRAWLANAIIYVGSASRRAVEAIADLMVKEKTSRDTSRLQDVLRATFKDSASFDVTISGRSTKQWDFAALVRRSDHWTLFDLVAAHHVSINSSIVKFQDMTRLEDAPKSVAVLSNRTKMDAADIQLISDAAQVVMPLEGMDAERVLLAA